MRKFIIDTDTAADDAVALIMALRNKTILIQAITTVAGNVDLPQATGNALASVEAANTYRPPVFRGAHRPLLRKPQYAQYVHGEDGLGNSGITPRFLAPSEGNAADAIIKAILRHPNEIELVTLGPLTNLAIAYRLEPRIARLVKRVTVMGGSGFESGNVSPVSEFNIDFDAEAADIVFDSPMPITLVGFELSTGESTVTGEELEKIRRMGRVGEYIETVTRSLRGFTHRQYGRDGIDLPDPVTMAAAIDPTICEYIDVYARAEYRGMFSYGQIVMDRDIKDREHTAKLAVRLDAGQFKKMLFDSISG